MNKEDKIISKKAALVVANQIASNIPALNIAWGLCKALYGAGMELRRERVLEWVEFVRDNPSVFGLSVLSDIAFQDGFVFLFEQYLVERSERKRKILKNILLGFAKSVNFEEFQLEQFSNMAKSITVEDLEILSIFVDGTVRKWEKNHGTSFGAFHSCLQYEKLMLGKMKSLTQYENENFTYERFMNLANLGILVQPVGSIGGMGSGYSNDRFRLSDRGRIFIEFLKK